MTPKLGDLFTTCKRPTIATVIQLRTGHGFFNSYLFEKPNNTVTTRYCTCTRGNIQTPDHLLMHCRNYEDLRRPGDEETGPLTVTTLQNNPRHLPHLLQFL